MTQEQKQILLEDLCARLPYGVKLRYVEDLVIKKESHIITLNNIYLEHIINGDADIKPYLRPMSSMTEEEYTEYCTMRGRNCDYGEATISVSKSLYPRHLYDDGEPVKITVFYPNPVIQDWLNKKMFDYRGLIEKGLAIEAPKDIYEIK